MMKVIEKRSSAVENQLITSFRHNDPTCWEYHVKAIGDSCNKVSMVPIAYTYFIPNVGVDKSNMELLLNQIVKHSSVLTSIPICIIACYSQEFEYQIPSSTTLNTMVDEPFKPRRKSSIRQLIQKLKKKKQYECENDIDSSRDVPDINDELIVALYYPESKKYQIWPAIIISFEIDGHTFCTSDIRSQLVEHSTTLNQTNSSFVGIINFKNLFEVLEEIDLGN